MTALDLVNLTRLMQRTSGRADIRVGLIDGPVATTHPDIASENIHEIGGPLDGTCMQAKSAACMHGTLVAGILFGKRDSAAPAICPGCTLLIRPIFPEAPSPTDRMPTATAEELAEAITQSVEAGAHVLNMSLSVTGESSGGDVRLNQALSYAASRGTICVAAAGNQGMLGGSTIVRHPWVIPVAACGIDGGPVALSNLGRSIGIWGLLAPGHNIVSLDPTGKTFPFGGTSAATAFVTGTVALLWSEFPEASASIIKLGLTRATTPRRRALVPPLLNAWTAYTAIARYVGSL